MQDILKKAAQIKLLIFDVDGVLTDGRLFYGDDGLEYKAFHSRDGHGMKMLQESGVTVAIITGRTSTVVTKRMENLGIKNVYQGQADKVPAYEELMVKYSLKPEQVAYVGDDIVDLPVMQRVGLAIAVQDAHSLVVKHSDWQASYDGGCGAARQVCELIMEAQNTLQEQFAKYLVSENR